MNCEAPGSQSAQKQTGRTRILVSVPKLWCGMRLVVWPQRQRQRFGQDASIGLNTRSMLNFLVHVALAYRRAEHKYKTRSDLSCGKWKRAWQTTENPVISLLDETYRHTELFKRPNRW